MKPLPILALSLLLVGSNALAEFSWTDTEGTHLDLKFGDRSVARYVYEAIDESTPETRERTYKPFCHVFRWDDGGNFITKGPGGKFTHHRGIYYGFSKCSYVDADGNTHKNIDTWHCRKAYQLHKSFSKQEASAESASFTAEIDWFDNEGKVFAKEERKMTFSMRDKDLVVDFYSSLAPTVPKLTVDGDPQHAGFQFRAHNDVNDKTAEQTYYIRPNSGVAKPGTTINWSAKTDNETTRDLPWKGMCFTLDGDKYTVAYLDSPDNPKPARYSERNYGRFGSYFVADATKDSPLEVDYRLVIRKGEMTPEDIAGLSGAFLKK